MGQSRDENGVPEFLPMTTITFRRSNKMRERPRFQRDEGNKRYPSDSIVILILQSEYIDLKNTNFYQNYNNSEKYSICQK